MITDEWKRALVTPLPKVTTPTQPKDYRPISLLSVVVRVFEAMVAARLYVHFVEGGRIKEYPILEPGRSVFIAAGSSVGSRNL